MVRHGQAGTREHYDSLSELGRTQARLLGEHFRAQGIHFSAAYSGALARQRATAEWEKVKKVYPPAQLLAGLQVLKGVYREVGEEKHYLFARNGNLGWILAYVTESAAATN